MVATGCILFDMRLNSVALILNYQVVRALAYLVTHNVTFRMTRYISDSAIHASGRAAPLTDKVKKISRRLKVMRRTLLLSYEDEALHQLRVGLRRIRSLLQLQPGGKARRLRRDLGALADATGAARDWDTLAIYARNRLSPDQFSQLHPRLDARRAVAHRQVERMLRSKKWSTTTKRWKKYARQTKFASSSPSYTGGGLSQAIYRASSAGHRALSRDDDRIWHKLRIAIKELRYELENTTKNKRRPEAAETLVVCERLQDDLGDWHDTVVHRRLLCELGDSAGRGGSVRATSALQTLAQLIDQDSLDSLEQIKSTMRALPFY
jgi:CHAD domain-containing protein